MIFDLYLYSSDLVVALRLLPVTLYPNSLKNGKQMTFILSKLKAAKVGTSPLKSQIIVASSYIPHTAPRHSCHSAFRVVQDMHTVGLAISHYDI